MLNIPVIALVLTALVASVAEAQGPTSDQTYLEFQVHRPVRVKEPAKPLYPQRLQSARIPGEVLVQFVVTEKGDADLSSFKVIKSSDKEFSESVRRAVATAAFYPAEFEGKRVNQLVQLTFRFEAK